MSASRKLGMKEAVDLVRKARKVHVAKGKSRQTFEVQTDDVEAIVASMLGPTGNLRAPCLVVGDQLLVGFQAQMYQEVLEEG